MKRALLLLAACDGSAPAGPQLATSQLPTPGVAHDAAPANTASLLTRDAAAPLDATSTDATATAQIDPPDPDAITISWLVGDATIPGKLHPERLHAPLSVEITAAGKTRRELLAPQFGALKPRNQASCGGTAYPLDKHEVAKITFYEGGAGGYVFRRKPADTLTVFAWEQTDGSCPDARGEPAACPTSENRIFRMRVPGKARVVERILEVDAHGVVTGSFDCKH